MGKNQNEFVKEITPQGEDFSQWYTDVIKKADMVDYAPVKGCMVIKPYGYRIWELLPARRTIQRNGHQTPTFPFYPGKFFCKEAEHVEGLLPRWPGQLTRGRITERLGTAHLRDDICAINANDPIMAGFACFN